MPAVNRLSLPIFLSHYNSNKGHRAVIDVCLFARTKLGIIARKVIYFNYNSNKGHRAVIDVYPFVATKSSYFGE